MEKVQKTVEDVVGEIQKTDTLVGLTLERLAAELPPTPDLAVVPWTTPTTSSALAGTKVHLATREADG